MSTDNQRRGATLLHALLNQRARGSVQPGAHNVRSLGRGRDDRLDRTWAQANQRTRAQTRAAGVAASHDMGDHHWCGPDCTGR